MQVLLLPRLQSAVMAITGLVPAKGPGVGYLTTIFNLHPQVMVQHFVVDDALYHVAGYVTLVENGIDADNFGSVGIAGKLNGILVSHPPVGSPGNVTVNPVIEILGVDLVEKYFEIDETPLVTQHGSPGLARRPPDLGGVGSDKISQHGRRFLVSALYELRQ